MASPEVLAAGHGLWALVEDARCPGSRLMPVGQRRLQPWEGYASFVT